MDDVEIETEQPTNANSAPSSSYRSKRRRIEYYDNVAFMDTNEDILVSQLYPSKKALKQHLGMLAIRKNYEFKVNKSASDRFEVRCVDPNCKWRLRAIKLQDLAYFEVRKFHNEHSCSLDIIHRDHRQASSSLIGQYVKSKFEGGTSRIYRPRDIIDDARVQLGVNMGYNKAWRAREAGLETARGLPEESFAVLPTYYAMLERKNQGTITHIETDEQNHFLYFFMAIGASIRGFRDSVRPVIAIDGAFLKGKYFGTMFVAACQDGENQIYLLAFGVVDSENDASWSWFLTKLRGAIGVVENLIFISDRHGSIAKAVDNVFPEAHHGVCIFHIANNLQSKFGKKMKILKLYYTATKKYQVSEFNTLMDDIRKIKDGEVCKYLEDIGCHKWARGHFMGYRYNMMTSNIAESMNSKLKDARKLPITALVDHLREVLQQWFVERRDAASSLNTHLTKWAEDKVYKNNNSGSHMRMSPIDLYAFQIHDQSQTFTVDLNNMTCTCREFDLDRLPCAHATVACRTKGISVYSMCSQFYTANALMLAYAEPIWPVGNKSEWDVAEDVQNKIVLPPIRQVVPGRRKAVRIPSVGEDAIRKKCTRCGEGGHNRATCQNPIPLV
ncbi:uncharacterized protein LOC133737456 [Rosa rugosa]|uniref:uncharacterized protein LOC133737456 n=1 Tax=Rosa rugosa TaxID=74645 RepID=UPI002B4117F1|nr:uncharacterized protein LOC133737456 [Rosa rugosa]